MSVSAPCMQVTLDNMRQTLLDRRNEQGHWTGFLSTSALSTATAVVALWMHDPDKHRPLIDRGLEWICKNKNKDGGWGDTVLSVTNINTTALCYAALACGEADKDDIKEATTDAETWLRGQTGGSLDAQTLVDTILAFYGKDRTFSTPILTLLTLTGRLGDRREAFKRVPQLPFELAAFPQTWFKHLNLRVVSYALPALIAIGQNRHHHRPTWNPFMRVLRNACRKRTMALMERIQPENGGFLEAIPLTCFVVANLCGMGQHDHIVVKRSVSFIYDLMREDGGWPIDTNLATWITTLSVNALGVDRDVTELVDIPHIRDWILGQQFTEVHPFTNADPGGWSWTDLPGAVPDADDTPGALLALDHIAADDPRVPQAVAAGVTWLLDLQNRDGGIPTFCRGWGALPFDQSAADISSHTLAAWLRWRDRLPQALQARVANAIPKLLAYLRKSQRPDGSWVPLWFGNEHQDDDINPTYGTSRCLIALSQCELQEHDMLQAAVTWLLQAQQADGAWSGTGRGEPSLEETGLAVDALASMKKHAPHIIDALPDGHVRCLQAMQKGCDWLITATEQGTSFTPHPIGFYFAKLWYYESTYPVIFPLQALEKVHAWGYADA